MFLRVLEYYPGILILTTNRVGIFDEAIKSRVHCPLYYPRLDEAQTLKVWDMNITMLKERNQELGPQQRVQFDSDEIRSFARKNWTKGDRKTRWNGRQIKNAFQTAVALAEWDSRKESKSNGNTSGPVLKREHFRKVEKASRHFDKYLSKTRRDDEVRARENELREDDFHSVSDDSGSDGMDEEDVTQRKTKSSKKKKQKARGKENEKYRSKKPMSGSKSTKHKRSKPSSSEDSESELGSITESEEQTGSESPGSVDSTESSQDDPPPKKRSSRKKTGKGR